MTPQERLDETDKKILRLLQENSRLTVKELAAQVNLSPTPTFERQKRLERDGYKAVLGRGGPPQAGQQRHRVVQHTP